jgi:hypothetical protein
LLAQLEQLQENERRHAAWEVSVYSQIVPPLLDTLKAITGKAFTSYKDYQKWWDEEGKKFEVID